MKIIELMSEINPNTFMEDYCKIKGIEDVDGFLNPSILKLEDTKNYRNITEGAKLLKKHIEKDSKITIVLHADMDSMLTNSLIYMYLKDVKKDLNIDVIFPTVKAQGFNREVMKYLRENLPDLILMGDAGSSDIDEVKELKSLGVDIIISDHHIVENKAKGIDNYCILINNHHSPELKNKKLSGCGVTWKLFQHMDLMNNTNYSDKYIDLVAISLLSDVCDTKELENRKIMNLGFNKLKNSLIKEAYRTFGKNIRKELIPEDWSWNVNKFFNSCIKLGYSKELFWGFVSPNENCEWKQGKERISTRKGTALERAIYILRNKIEEKNEIIITQLKKFDSEDNYNRKVIVAIDDGTTHKFLGGDIANKLNGLYNKPALMLMDNEDYYTGSCRSPIPIKNILSEMDLFDYCGGHDSSFGIKIRKDKLPLLMKKLEELDLSIETQYEVIKKYNENEKIKNYMFDLIDDNLKYFAKGFENPLFAFEFDLNCRNIEWMCDGLHLKFCKNNIQFLKFNVSDLLKNKLNENVKVRLVGKLSISSFKGQKNNQVIIQDMEIEKTNKKELTWEDIF